MSTILLDDFLKAKEKKVYIPEVECPSCGYTYYRYGIISCKCCSTKFIFHPKGQYSFLSDLFKELSNKDMSLYLMENLYREIPLDLNDNPRFINYITKWERTDVGSLIGSIYKAGFKLEAFTGAYLMELTERVMRQSFRNFGYISFCQLRPDMSPKACNERPEMLIEEIPKIIYSLVFKDKKEEEKKNNLKDPLKVAAQLLPNIPEFV